ncbi:MAG: hypothetical protein K9L02_06395 [Acholeplasmataceae bacterium]|nr:hypothetical protein [Acholeplasmataceae bacterium]
MDLQYQSNLTLIKITKWMILAMILIIPIQIAIFLIIPMPETALQWIELFKEHSLMGLLHMDILYVLNNTFLIFFYVVLYITLRNKKANSLLNIALLTGIIGAILYYTSNRSIEMLYLSRRYFETNDVSLRLSYLATAASYLDVWKGTSFNIYYVLSAISLILFSIVMYLNTFYSRATSISGLISGMFMIIPSSFGTIGLIFSLISLIPWIVFSILVFSRLVKVKKDTLEHI